MNRREMSLRTKFFLLVALGSIFTATAAYLLHFRFLDNLATPTPDGTKRLTSVSVYDSRGLVVRQIPDQVYTGTPGSGWTCTRTRALWRCSTTAPGR